MSPINFPSSVLSGMPRTMTHQEWLSASRDIAEEIVNNLHRLTQTIQPDPDIAPIPATWNQARLKAYFSSAMAELLLSVVRVETLDPTAAAPVGYPLAPEGLVQRQPDFRKATEFES
jgi:hypothetical protein